MKIYKITEASEYLGVSINTLKTLANKGGFSNSDDKRLFRFYYDGSMMELYLSGDKEALVIRSGMRDTDIRDMIVLAYNKGLENGLKGCQGAS